MDPPLYVRGDSLSADGRFVPGNLVRFGSVDIDAPEARPLRKTPVGVGASLCWCRLGQRQAQCLFTVSPRDSRSVWCSGLVVYRAISSS